MRWSSLASTSMTADRLFLQRLHLAPQLAALRGAEQSGDDRPMEGHHDLRQRCRHRQQGGAEERAKDDDRGVVARQWPEEPGQRRPTDGVVPDRHRQERQGQRPDDRRDEELDDRQRQVDRDVEHVAPAALVGELGAQDVDDAAAERPVRVGDRPDGLTDERPPPLDPGDEPRPLDGEGDEDDADAGQEGGQADRREGRRSSRTPSEADEQPEGDRGVRVPGGRMDRREQERLDRVAPRRANAKMPPMSRRRRPENGRSPAERMSLRRGSGLTPARPGSAAALRPGRCCRSRFHRLPSNGPRRRRKAPMPIMTTGTTKCSTSSAGRNLSMRARLPNRIRAPPTNVVQGPSPRVA